MSKTVKIPEGMDTPRFKMERTVTIPDGSEIPLIGPEDPRHKKVQERWIAHVKIFDLSKAEQLKEYEEVWQAHCDGLGQVDVERGPEFDATQGRFVTFVKWHTYEHVAPTAAQL